MLIHRIHAALSATALCVITLGGAASADDPAPYAYYSGEGVDGPGQGKHVVFVTGDEEYRSEEGMPALAKILSKRMGFRTTVLFAVQPKTGEIDPNTSDNIPGLEHLDGADLMVIFTRFRDLPDDQMKHIVDYVEAGRPVVGLRTATHAFNMKKHHTYDRYTSFSKEWPGGFGRQILGETWVAHHGGHGSQSTRGVVSDAEREHPILRGITTGDVWDPSDVYTVRLPMFDDVRPLLLGEVVEGMSRNDPRAMPRRDGKTGEIRDKNDPMMPLAWVRELKADDHNQRVFATTMGSAPAFSHEGSRRLIVNACLWAMGMENAITGDENVDLIGEYEPTMFGFGKAKKGIYPSDHLLPESKGS